jgi:hypothetical protein
MAEGRSPFADPDDWPGAKVRAGEDGNRGASTCAAATAMCGTEFAEAVCVAQAFIFFTVSFIPFLAEQHHAEPVLVAPVRNYPGVIELTHYSRYRLEVVGNVAAWPHNGIHESAPAPHERRRMQARPLRPPRPAPAPPPAPPPLHVDFPEDELEELPSEVSNGR